MKYINKTFCIEGDDELSFTIIEEKVFDDTYGAIYLAVTSNNNGIIVTELDLNIWLRHEMIYDCTEICSTT